MTDSALLAWHDYFVTVAQVGATLAGLLFVGLTISLNHMLAGDGYLARAFTALFLQFETLLIGLFGVVPGQPPYVLGLEFIVSSLAVLGGITLFARNFRESAQSYVLGSAGPRRVRRVLTLCGTLLPVAAGIGMILGLSGALYLLIPSEIACLYLSIANAWVFAVEIPRRAARKPD